MKCNEKKKWKTESLAKKAIDIVTKKYNKKFYSYLCPYCNNYHLTSISKDVYTKQLKEQQKRRILKESEYWERKFKIEKY